MVQDRTGCWEATEGLHLHIIYKAMDLIIQALGQEAGCISEEGPMLKSEEVLEEWDMEWACSERRVQHKEAQRAVTVHLDKIAMSP